MRRIAIGTLLWSLAHMKMARVICGVFLSLFLMDPPRVFAGNNVSIKVEVDPRHPEMLPDCCLLGAEHGGWTVKPRHISPDDNICSEDFQDDTFPLISSLLQLSDIVFVYARSATPSLLPSNTTCKILNTHALRSPRWAADLQT